MTTPCIDPFVVATQGVTASPFLVAAQGLGCVAVAARTQGSAGTLLLRRVADGEAWLTGYRASSRAGQVRAQGSATPALSIASATQAAGYGVAIGRHNKHGDVTRSGAVSAIGHAAVSPLQVAPRKTIGNAVAAVGYAAVSPLQVAPRKTAGNAGAVIVSSQGIGSMCFTTYGVVSAWGQRSIVPMALSAILAMKRR